MKRAARLISILLVLSLIVAIPAQAAGKETAQTRGSAFFGYYSTWLYKTSSTSFEVWFDVDSNVDRMLEIGVSEIKVYRSSDQKTWFKIKTYTKSVYSNMTRENAFTHASHVDYDIASPGYYYRACVTFYARNSTGFGERYVYTGILHM